MEIVLAMLLSAPLVGVHADGVAPCDSKGFARALATLRPELRIVPVEGEAAPPSGEWLARIEGMGLEQATLRVTGGPTAIVRLLPGRDCSRTLETAASIVDGLLDQLPDPLREASPRRAAVLQTSLAAWVGGGILQGPIQWVPSLALGARFGLASIELAGSVDVGLPASIPLATVDEGRVGTYQAVPVDLELGAGWGPRLGPGRLSLDGSVGVALASISTKPLAGHLFDRQSQTSAAFFLAAAAGYVFELPARLIVGLKVEERLAPVQFTVTVDGAQQGDHVLTRLWTFTSLGIVGWRFF